MSIKPIETVYKDYRFRSRLEARWAIFFDSLGIEWEYEPEGYVLGEHGWYLPDFKIKGTNIFVEVKGVEPDDKYLKMLEHFGESVNGAVLLVEGQPHDFNFKLYCSESTWSGGGHSWMNVGIYTFNNKLIFYRGNDRKDRDLMNLNFGEVIPSFCKEYGEEKYWIHENQEMQFGQISKMAEVVRKSFIKAKQARFEHGEKP